MTRREITVGIAVLLMTMILVVLTLLLHHLFTGQGQSTTAAWSPAIQSITAIVLAIATIVLVFVTVRYVLLTRQLVVLQGDFITPERARKREEATHQLATIVADGVLMLDTASKPYPFKDISTLDASRIRSTNEINNLAETLFRIVASLPNVLVKQCRTACDACGNAYLAQSALYETLRRTSMELRPGVDGYDGNAPQYDWNDAKNMYVRLVERGEVWDDEWIDIREGKFVLKAEAATSKLYDEVTEYLASDPLPQESDARD